MLDFNHIKQIIKLHESNFSAINLNNLDVLTDEEIIAFSILELSHDIDCPDCFVTLEKVLSRHYSPKISSVCRHQIVPKALLKDLNISLIEEKLDNYKNGETGTQNLLEQNINSIHREFIIPPKLEPTFSSYFKPQNDIHSPKILIKKNLRVYFNKRNHVVFGNTDNSIIGYFSHGNIELISNSNFLNKPRFIPGKTLLIAGLTVGTNYYHWLIDVLPRIQRVINENIQFDKILFPKIFLKEYNIQTLELFGINKEKITISDNSNEHVVFEQAIIPSFAVSFNNPNQVRIPVYIIDLLRKSFFNSSKFKNSNRFTNYPDKIFINRKSSRKILNENDFLNFISSLGYENIYLEDFNIYEQASLFRNANNIIAIHGAGLVNLVFCEEKTEVTELFNSNYLNNCYWVLATQSNLKYKCYINSSNLLSTHNFLKTNPNFSNEGVFVNISELKQILEV